MNPQCDELRKVTSSPIRWRSEAMRPFHDEPEYAYLHFHLDSTQKNIALSRPSFSIKNCTGTRFGDLERTLAFGSISIRTFPLPNGSEDCTSACSSNKQRGKVICSFVSRSNYLTLCILGYSIFAIRSFEDDSTPNPLPPCVADEAASALTDTSLSDLSDPSELLEPSTASQQASSSRVEGFEDEDLELQAALQASLMDGAGADLVLPTHTLPPSRQQPSFPPGLGASGLTDPDDPVAASLARNRAMLARMQAQQAQALREGYEEEAARIDVINRARQRAEARGMQMAVDDDDGDEDDEDYEPSDFEHDHRQRNTPPIPQDDMEQTDEARWGEPLQLPPPIPRLITRPARRPSPPDIGSDQDQDLDLAAAIRASLEDDSMGNPEHSRGASTANQSATPLGQAPRESASQVEEVEAQEEVSIDEMRRKRLARFGG